MRARGENQGCSEERHSSSQSRARILLFFCIGTLNTLYRYESLKTTFDELKLRFDVSEDSLQRTKDEIELLKFTSGRN